MHWCHLCHTLTGASFNLLEHILVTYDEIKLAGQRGRLVNVTPAKASSRGQFEDVFFTSPTCILLQSPQRISKASLFARGSGSPGPPMATASGCFSPSNKM